MHTIIRDRTTSTADFVFYADRLLRLVSSLLLLLWGAACLPACQVAPARRAGQQDRQPWPCSRAAGGALDRRWWRLGWDTCPSRSGL